ncbi:MAG: hypothetical protein OXH79_22440 [Boseongicola sp.]|nr:hypothetical protein [Boseongicola sp.]
MRRDAGPGVAGVLLNPGPEASAHPAGRRNPTAHGFVTFLTAAGMVEVRALSSAELGPQQARIRNLVEPVPSRARALAGVDGGGEFLLDATCGDVACAFGHDLDRNLEDPDGMPPEPDALALHLRWSTCGLPGGSCGSRAG